MIFPTNPESTDTGILKDRAYVNFGPNNGEPTLDLARQENEVEQVRVTAGGEETVTNVTNITTVETQHDYGTFASGYWYTSDEVGKAVTTTFAHGVGYIFPFTVKETSVIDAFGVCVHDNLAGGVTNFADYYYARLGIYSEVDGVPLNKIAETSEFNYGDGSMTNTAFNVLSLGAPVTLIAGRYWILFIRSSDSNLANPAYIRFRSTGGSAFFGPMEATDIYANSATVNGYRYVNPNNPTGSGPAPWSTVLPTQLDFWNEIGAPSSNVPEVWLRGA